MIGAAWRGSILGGDLVHFGVSNMHHREGLSANAGVVDLSSVVVRLNLYSSGHGYGAVTMPVFANEPTCQPDRRDVRSQPAMLASQEEARRSPVSHIDDNSIYNYGVYFFATTRAFLL